MLSKYSLSNSPFSASYPHYVLYMKYSEALHKFMLFCERNVYGCKVPYLPLWGACPIVTLGNYRELSIFRTLSAIRRCALGQL